MHIRCGVTVIGVHDLPHVVQKLSLKDPQTKLTGFEKQLKVSRQLATLGDTDEKYVRLRGWVK